MMKKIMFIAVFILTIGVTAHAQILKPVTWSYAAKRLDKNKVMVYLKATMERGWHIYSTRQEDGGPVKTSIEFDKKGTP